MSIDCRRGYHVLVTEADKTSVIKALAVDVGFDRVGVAEARPIARVPYLTDWLASGRAGSMTYLHRNSDIRRDPRQLLDGARSVIVVAMNYHQPEPPVSDEAVSRGRVAMYAWGNDYHKVVKRRLHTLVDSLRERLAEPFDARCCVDTVPILERELAAAAGIGWIGKNTMMLHSQLGSYFFLGEVVTTLALKYDEPVADHCGSCTRCLDACPTGAFPAPYEMDASKCVSYLTIEHRDDIPPELRPGLGDWVFGCDVCQQVCPYNRGAPVTTAFPIREPGPRPDLDSLINGSDEGYRRILAGSAMKRATPAMLRRNATIAARNAHG